MRRLIILLLSLLFGLVQPANADAQSNEPADNARSAIESILKPHNVQATLSESKLQSAISVIEKLAQKQVDENVVPGLAISIVHNDRVVFAKGFGVRIAGKSEKIDADTVFQLASVSKPIASTEVAALVGEGKISWDSKIRELDPIMEYRLCARGYLRQ